METFRTVSDVRLSAVTPAPSDAKTPKTKFEFMNLPLFTYKPSHNPIARSGISIVVVVVVIDSQGNIRVYAIIDIGLADTQRGC